jgi:hypothetical protein
LGAAVALPNSHRSRRPVFFSTGVPNLSANEIANLELRIEQLKQKVAQRERQQTDGMSEGQHGGRAVGFLDSLRKELHEAALSYLNLKCQTGAWNPVTLINIARMK